MVAFWVDEELEGRIKVSVGFTDRADVVRRVVDWESFVAVTTHVCGVGRKDEVAGSKAVVFEAGPR